MLRAGECITGRQFKRMYHVSLIASNCYNISILIDNSVKNRDNLKNVLQSVYTNKEAVDDELVEVTIFFIKPSNTAIYRHRVYIERRHCLDCKPHKCLESSLSRVVPIIYFALIRDSQRLP